MEWEAGGAARCFNKRKHIEINHNYIMSMLEKDIVKLVPVRSEKMETNLLTKLLAPTDLQRASDAVNIFDCAYNYFVRLVSTFG